MTTGIRNLVIFILISLWFLAGPKVGEVRAATCATPTITLAAGSYTGSTNTTTITVTGSCSVICYTTDGSTPGATSGTCNSSPTQTYSTAIPVDHTMTIKALATKSGANNSSVATSAYTITVDTPTFGTNGGSFNNDTTSTILDAFTGATICYTTDGATPAATTPGTCLTSDGHTLTYSTAVSITKTGTVIKAIGTKSGTTNSALATSTAFTLTVANPTFGTNGGSFNNDTSTSFSSTTTGAIFCSTLDGTTPAAATAGTCSAGATGASATVTATGTTVNVLGTKANYVNSSVQTSNPFTLTVGAVTSSPGAGTYSGPQSVTLAISTTTGAVIHYTTDGTAVTCSSPVYSGAFNVSSTTTVKAIGCKTNYVSDTAISDLYTIAVISVSITSNGTVAYGNLGLGQTKSTIDLVNTQTAKNDGNVPEDFTIKTSAAVGGTGWTVGSVAGTNIFVHEFSTDAGSIWTKFTAADTYSVTNLATNLAVNGTQNFDLRLTVPTASDSISKSITITILATQH